MKPKFATSDPDIIGSWPAMQRAARRAKQLALRTGTPFMVVRDGKLINLTPAAMSPRVKSTKLVANTTYDINSVGARLFKYRALGTQREYALDILANHRLYVSPVRSLNDPFECRANISFGATDAEKLNRTIARLKLEDPSISDGAARSAAPERIRLVERNGVGQIEAAMENHFGFVSFGGARDNLLMWAHYADAHQGLVLEFDATKVADQTLLRSVEFFGTALKVQYADGLPTIHFYTDDLHAQAEKLVLTKSNHWHYEEERRIVKMDRARSQYQVFAPEFLTAIYLGYRTTDDDRKAVQDCLKSRGSVVPLFRAILSKTKFGLDFERLS